MAWQRWILVMVWLVVLSGDVTSLSRENSSQVNESVTSSKKVLCYYTVACPGQHPPAPLPVSAINATLCTHIVISSAVVHNTSIRPCTPAHIEVYKNVVSLKKKHPRLQVLVRLEGNWTALIHDPLDIAVFAYNAKQFLHKFSLDGVEVAWESLTWPLWGKDTAQSLSLLLLQLNNALQLASRPPFTLSLAVSASQNSIDRAYDIRILNQTVDFVSVSAYNFHTYLSYLPFTGHGSPLLPREVEHGYWATLNTHWAMMYWLHKGLPRDKLVMVIPTFANTWKLLSSSWTRVGAPAAGPGIMDGRMTYSQVCVYIQRGSAWHWDEESRVPYAWRSTDWISYEDETSVKEKAQMVMKEDLAGVAVLDLNSDDWNAKCPEKTSFSLVKAAMDVLSHPEHLT